ncbi:MAG TPA: hypothetical protein VIK82_06595 [Porticoccaceae bacterium]
MLLVLLLMLLYLFYPFYDLYVRKDPFVPGYSLVSKGFWTEEACTQAAEVQRAVAYRCNRTSSWERIFGAAVSFAGEAP